MDWSTLFSPTNVAAFLGGAVGMQALQYAAKWMDGVGSDFVVTEVKKLQAKIEATSAGKILSQFSAEQALWKLIEAEVPVVFAKLDADVKLLITSGDLTKVNWAQIGKDIWAGIRDQAQGGMTDYLAHGAIQDGEELAGMIAQKIFARFHMNVALTAANPAPVQSTTTTTVAAPIPADSGAAGGTVSQSVTQPTGAK